MIIIVIELLPSPTLGHMRSDNYLTTKNICRQFLLLKLLILSTNLFSPIIDPNINHNIITGEVTFQTIPAYYKHFRYYHVP